MATKFRINYRLYARYREIKYKEKTQIFDNGGVDAMGVRINFEHLGKVLEAKNRVINGEEGIMDFEKPEKQKINFVDSLIYFKNKIMGV